MKLHSRDYAKILYEITKDKKDKEIPEVLKGFVSLLIRNNDLKKSDEIMKHFSEVYNNENGIVEVKLRSARELSADSQKLIEKYVNELTGAKKVIISPEVDKKVIGGFVLKYGSTIIDASIKGKLHNFKNKIEK